MSRVTSPDGLSIFKPNDKDGKVQNRTRNVVYHEVLTFADEDANITEGQDHANVIPASSEAEPTDVIMIDDSDDNDDGMYENVGDINQDTYICQYCNVSFITESSLLYHNLMDHRLIIGNDDQYSDDLTCWICDHEIGNKEKLLEHLNNVHPESADIPVVDILDDSNSQDFKIPAQIASKCTYSYMHHQF